MCEMEIENVYEDFSNSKEILISVINRLSQSTIIMQTNSSLGR